MTVPQKNFEPSTHQKSPFLEVSILGNAVLVHSKPCIHKNSNISKPDEGMFMKFQTKDNKTYINHHINFHKYPLLHMAVPSINLNGLSVKMLNLQN